MTRIQGIIIPAAWNDNGSIAEVGIETFGEDFYLIDPTSDNYPVKMLLHQAVEISGRIIHLPGKKMIRVDRVTPIEKDPGQSVAGC